MSSQQKGFRARMKEPTGFSDEAVSVDFIHMYAGEFLCAQMLGRGPGPAVRELTVSWVQQSYNY